MINSLYQISKRTFMLSITAIAMFVANSGIAFAASSSWQDLGGGKARVLAHLNPTTNKVSGVIDVVLEDGWSTYWRYPGSSGIPPRFDFSNSIAFSSGEVHFPAPQLITQTYGSYAGYKKKVMFPFEGDLLSNGGAKIQLDLLIGICSEVCIPAQAQFEIKGSDLFQSDPEAVQAVSFAKITIPKKRNAKDILISKEQENLETLYIKTKHNKSYGKPSMFVEGPSNWFLLPAELMTQDDNSATFKLDVSRAPKDADIMSTTLRYTLVTGTSGVEIEH